MKVRLAYGFLGSLAIAASLLGNFARSSQASSRYFCGIYPDGSPATVVRTNRGDVALIKWVAGGESIWGDRWTPTERCREVSQRFQAYADNGTLRYLATGEIGSYSVICAVSERGQACEESNILVTLAPGSDRYQVARQLLDLSSLARNSPISLRGRGGIESYEDGELYYDFDRLVEAAPVEEDIEAVEATGSASQ